MLKDRQFRLEAPTELSNPSPLPQERPTHPFLAPLIFVTTSHDAKVFFPYRNSERNRPAYPQPPPLVVHVGDY